MVKYFKKYLYLIGDTVLLFCVAFFYFNQFSNSIELAHAGGIIKWEEVEGSKVIYADKILQSNLLQGMKRKEIIEKLGKPEYQTDGAIYYSTIQMFSADPTTFEIYFDEKSIFESGKIKQG